MSEEEKKVETTKEVKSEKPKEQAKGDKKTDQAVGSGEKRSFHKNRSGNNRFDRNNRGGNRFNKGDKKGGQRKGGFKGKRNDRRKKRGGNDLDPDIFSEIIAVRRVTRVAKGGKRMRFSALVVVGDKKGRVGYAIKKGVDFQGAVSKATKKARSTMIKINITEEGSVPFPVKTKYKAARIFLKPADQGTGLIAGGYARPVLELAGIQNVYSKIIGGTNKISGVQAIIEALKNYTVNNDKTAKENKKNKEEKIQKSNNK